MIEEKPKNINSLILDSGVWALNQGTLKHKSNVKIYSKFLTRRKHLFNFYFNYDEKFDGDPLEINWANQIYLEDNGHRPVPVIHSFTKQEINHFLSFEGYYDKIAIGSTLSKDPQHLKDVVELFYTHNFKVHVFAYGSYKRLLGLKAWSTDCSSFARWVSVGRVIFYSELMKEEVTFSFLPEDRNGNTNDDFIDGHKYKKYNILEEYQDYIYTNLGLTKNDLATETILRTVANSFYFSSLEKKITERQISDGLVFDTW
ncbi:hypothetical protein GTA51_10040 [Desulfovibrio aerotolerans]|uniref:Uncharacterized protein n=1 Tax=Solidesulfovibrio aerotolerans TaxID=295255 RepID=A0A7C9ILB8_9BACT|nr:hypothetical protein [Solidesulfovibrio aerotolerans]MYL83465.1 hypothetical protein [Solidesulfovibrio aerotolerans]